ncbi:MAG: squalene synthase HpnC [Phycisphaerae bacterium]|nr:squalene synthase HpnC [Phycisphaerae bacterium]
MSVHSIIDQLQDWGPGQRPGATAEEAIAYCRRLALGHYENFSVLSRMVPEPMREGAAVVYAFCRWADDLGDEIGDSARSLELLAWWRGELEACFHGEGFHHPVFVALASIREQYDLQPKPFLDLIDAFEQDQRVSRYETWDQVIDYCRRSADPVGRLVLRLADQDHNSETLVASDAICTALQLANHWQDARRDLVERDRIYIPVECHASIQSFEDRFRWTIEHGHAPDHQFLGEWREMMQSMVKRTWPGFEKIYPLLDALTPELRPMIWLFAAGGSTILRKIEQVNYETVLFRPRIGLIGKLALLLSAKRASRRPAA